MVRDVRFLEIPRGSARASAARLVVRARRGLHRGLDVGGALAAIVVRRRRDRTHLLQPRPQRLRDGAVDGCGPGGEGDGAAAPAARRKAQPVTVGDRVCPHLQKAQPAQTHCTSTFSKSQWPSAALHHEAHWSLGHACSARSEAERGGAGGAVPVRSGGRGGVRLAWPCGA